MSLDRVVANALGLDRVTMVPAAGGAAHDAYLVEGPDGTPVAFLRTEAERDGDTMRSKYGLAREARMLRHVRSLGFPVPDVLAEIDDPPGMLMNVVSGTSRPEPSEVERVAPEYLALVARLHRTDPTDMPIEQYPTMDEAVRQELAWWQGLALTDGVADVPLLRLAHHVLTHHLPHLPDRPSVVHGDIGPGNFMVDDGRVSAMLDWELAHLGDPLEDMAWLWMRGAHTDFGDTTLRLAQYEEAAGTPIDPLRLDWHLALVMWKSCLSLRSGLMHWPATDGQLIRAVVSLTYGALLGSQLVHILGGALPLLTETPERARTVSSHLAEVALAAGPLPRMSELCLEYVRDSAAQTEWERARFEQDAASLLPRAPDAALADLDQLDDGELLGLVTLWARAADRAAQAMPKAVRRIERAQRIGLGVERPTTRTAPPRET